MTPNASEFLRRFLLHVLPGGFVHVRHYGLLSNRHRHEKVAACRELLDRDSTPEYRLATPAVEPLLPDTEPVRMFV